MLAYLIDNKVHQILLENDPIFPNIPIEERYSSEFLDKCVKCNENTKQGMIYQDEQFLEPPIIEPEISIEPEFDFLPTKSELQSEYNLDLDYRLSMQELKLI